ncbi:DUF6243 family protein [Streptomyces sp. DH12]|uniref:DUF6243 family protein n=1 Tax=Streptomyces sp. DH12 TaxID=2857010 RepID=UPI001E65153E|nr:DUF6243 family protein [Streptomyces sp. DH12]
MAKSRNNLLGVGGQRGKLSRGDRQGSAPSPDAAERRTAAAEAKQELLRKMRERVGADDEQESSEQQESQK